MRKREWLWIGIALLLAGGWVSGNDYLDEQYIVDAKQKAEQKKAALFATLISHCLNGSVLTIANEPIVECKPVKRRTK